MADVNAKNLVYEFANYLMDEFEDELDSPHFVEFFFQQITGEDQEGYSKWFKFRNNFLTTKQNFPQHLCSVDVVFFIKYFFDCANENIDLTKIDLPMCIKDDLNERWEGLNDNWNHIIFDNLSLSNDELKLPCISVLKGNIPTINSNPEDYIIVHSSYSYLYYYAYINDYNSFYNLYVTFQFQDNEEKIKLAFTNFGIMYNTLKVKVEPINADEVKISGKRLTLFTFIKLCEEEYKWQPFYDYNASYYEQAIDDGDYEFWSWQTLI